MAKYLKNAKLRHGVLTVEVALIFSLVIVLGHFFLPENGLSEHVDKIINIVLGRVTSDTGDYSPSGSGVVPDLPQQEEVKDTTAVSVVKDAVQQNFADHGKKNDINFEDIIAVNIVETGGKREVYFQTKENGDWQTVNQFFQSGHNSENIIQTIMASEGHDLVVPGIYILKN